MTQPGPKQITSDLVSCFSSQSLGINDVVEIVEKYRNRKYIEDIEYIEKDLGGMKFLLTSVRNAPVG